jgi:arylamine N-acetyltransferase
MSEDHFNQDAWLDRIGYRGERTPVLATLHGVIAAHSSAISYESIDVLLDRPPKLDLDSLQRKMIGSGRGGYCFEQNILFAAACARSGSMSRACKLGSCADWQSTRLAPCCTWCFR